MTATSIVYGLFGTGKIQPWDDPEESFLRERRIENKGLQMDERLSLISNRI